MKSTIAPLSLLSYSYVVRSFDSFCRYVATDVGEPSELGARGRVCVRVCERFFLFPSSLDIIRTNEHNLKRQSDSFRFEKTMNAAPLDGSPHFIQGSHALRNHIVHTCTQRQPYNKTCRCDGHGTFWVFCLSLCAQCSA